VLNVQHLSVLDLMDPAEGEQARLHRACRTKDEFENIAVTEPYIAAIEAKILRMHVKEIFKFQKKFSETHTIRERRPSRRLGRFVVIKADVQEALNMHPCMPAAAALLLDRHYNSLLPYRKGEITCTQSARTERASIRYLDGLRQSPGPAASQSTCPVEVIPIDAR